MKKSLALQTEDFVHNFQVQLIWQRMNWYHERTREMVNTKGYKEKNANACANCQSFSAKDEAFKRSSDWFSLARSVLRVERVTRARKFHNIVVLSVWYRGAQLASLAWHDMDASYPNFEIPEDEEGLEDLLEPVCTRVIIHSLSPFRCEEGNTPGWCLFRLFRCPTEWRGVQVKVAFVGSWTGSCACAQRNL